ncbi:MAG TPA: translational GTPase TypA [Candidatus Paceibacterota bacterium]
MPKQNLRNIAIIAHVDHGKTTLVDFLLKQSNTFREKSEHMSEDLIMDSNDLERERGITILAKNTAINYKGTKINIIDTPGHADFAGEVERTLHMADGCLLLVDAQEGPMPQTKFVLQKALEANLVPIVVISKIDKPAARPEEVFHETQSLFLELAVHESQLVFPVIWAVGREGKAYKELPTKEELSKPANLEPLFETILERIPAPKNSSDGPLQVLITTLDYDDFLGKYAIGRIERGIAKKNAAVVLIQTDGTKINTRIEKVFVSLGLERLEVEEASAGDIVALTGLAEASINTTVASVDDPTSLPPIAIQEPTLKISVGPNTSPFVGRDGKLLTSRQIKERLDKELETNVSLRMEVMPSGEFILSGRGSLHLTVLLETLRREGFELEVSEPKVVTKVIDGKTYEPVEELIIDISEEYFGLISGELGKRRGKLVDTFKTTSGTRLVYEVPTRAIIGLRNLFMTQTRGQAVMNSSFLRFDVAGPELELQRLGSLIASETGKALSNGIEVAQGRGITYILPTDEVYAGEVIGENAKEGDLEINVCKGRQLTNIRSARNDEKIQIAPPKQMNFEQFLDAIKSDELLEVTPKALRLRKRYLTKNERNKSH